MPFVPSRGFVLRHPPVAGIFGSFCDESKWFKSHVRRGFVIVHTETYLLSITLTSSAAEVVYGPVGRALVGEMEE